MATTTLTQEELLLKFLAFLDLTGELVPVAANGLEDPSLVRLFLESLTD